MKIRKVRRSKKFQYNKNRKRVFKKRQSLGKIKETDVKQYWDDKKAATTNIKDMGLAIDPNRSVPIPNFKQERLKIVKMVNDYDDEEDNEENRKPRKPRKAFVAEKLEEEAKAPRVSQFRLPKGHIKELIYFLDKYKLDYNAMVRDRRNFYQLTAKQFRSRIKKFMSIPEQFNEFLAERNIQPEEFDWEETLNLEQ
ncbi:nucleolar protein 16 [Condylostylus longicornis]|uniref:nucleolar protein 16 n=1 Tax=Condylostylus longicornis TaxID=2530218 RepID=UPI00244E0B99|nr:nucleolar protein 16 [Condylostylus longicornis]